MDLYSDSRSCIVVGSCIVDVVDVDVVIVDVVTVIEDVVYEVVIVDEDVEDSNIAVVVVVDAAYETETAHSIAHSPPPRSPPLPQPRPWNEEQTPPHPATYPSVAFSSSRSPGSC